MNNLTAKIPTFARVFRWFGRLFCWFFSWRMVRRYLITIACLITLVVAFYTIELWRGQGTPGTPARLIWPPVALCHPRWRN